MLAPAAVVAAAAIAFPLGVLAAISFSDVPPGHPFHYDIQEVADAGVTTGCGGGKFCPDDNVTRGQMAAFMNRLGALGAGKTPVVNADKVDGYQAAALLKVGPMTQQHPGPWMPNENTSGFTIKTYSNAVEVAVTAAGSGHAQLPLVAPTSIGGVTYGLSSVKLCTGSNSSNVTIRSTFVAEGWTTIIFDDTDRTPGSCYTVTDEEPTAVLANQVFLVELDFTAAGHLDVLGTMSTWVPTTAVDVKAPTKASDTTSP